MSKQRNRMDDHETSELETKLCIADRVETELRKTISLLEDVNRTQAEKIAGLYREADLVAGTHKKELATKDAEIARLKTVIEAQDKIIKYRGERLAERGH